jgi:hypothetical protein
MSTARANPFADVEALPAFTPKPKPKAPRTVPKEKIDQIAEANGFPSRQAGRAPAPRPPRRRFRTGRNQQINIKATFETITRLYALADAQRVPLGELLERALDALEGAGRVRRDVR